METAPTQHDEGIDSEVLPDGTALLNGQYVIERFLSSGGFGITYYARDSLNRRVVIKECFPEACCSRKNRTVMARSQSHQGEFKSIVDMFVREAHSIAKLNHPNIVGVHQVFQDNETAYMALDLIDGKDLLDIIEASEELPTYKDVNAILLKLLDAIATVHDQDMLHRDISPDNILIDVWDNPILIDFGAAREEASKKSRALSAVLVVKDGYSPQEFYIAGSHQTPCSDLYALAASFCHLITGDAPPSSQIRLAALASNRDDPYEPLVGRVEGYPKEFLRAIDTAMNVFPPDRIQNANDWILQIDAEKRRALALENAKDNRDIEDTVIKLIQSSQSEVEATAPAEVVSLVQPEQQPFPLAEPEPEPEPEPELTEYETAVEDWSEDEPEVEAPARPIAPAAGVRYKALNSRDAKRYAEWVPPQPVDPKTAVSEWLTGSRSKSRSLAKKAPREILIASDDAEPWLLTVWEWFALVASLILMVFAVYAATLMILV